MSFVAVTLYKVPSTRCPYKHHAEFADGKTLVDIKIAQLLQSGAEHVYVSTNDKQIKNSERVTYIQRPDKFCDEKTITWVETLSHVFNSVAISDEKLIVFSLTTIPLFSRYKEMLEEYKKTMVSLVAVHPSKHYYMTHDKRGANFSFGHWHTYSQAMHPMYQLCYATLSPIGKLRETGYTFPKVFDYFELDFMESLDIDTEEEFKLGQIMYECKFNEHV